MPNYCVDAATSSYEVIGTCQFVMNVEVREGSPELSAILDKVTVDGLPYHSGYTNIRGAKLDALIAARQSQCREYLSLNLDKLGDKDLALKCTEADHAIRELASDLLTGRITAGLSGAFPALLAAHTATTDRNGRILLQQIIDKVVSPVSETIRRKSIKELQRLAGGGAVDPVVAYVAKERLALRAQREADLKAIPGLSIFDLMAEVRAGKYAYDNKVKSAANTRIRTETIGADDVAKLLPLMDHEVWSFLNSLGIRKPVYIEFFQYRYARDRWNKVEVLEAIESTTARLYQRARNEFYGRLPDVLHNQMVLDGADEYVKAYIAFLAEKERANEQENLEAP